MSDPHQPGPPLPPQPGRGTQPAGAPGAPSSSRRRAWLIGGGVAALVLVAGGVGAVAAFSGGPPSTVEQAAEQAVEAARDLDVDAGARLMCTAPDGEQREILNDLIAEAREVADTDDPDVSYEVESVDGDRSGTARVRVEGEQSELEGAYLVVDLQVEEDGDRSCIAAIDAVEGSGPDR